MTTSNKFIFLFFLLSTIAGFQCKSSLNSTSQTAMYKSIYIDQFKLTYLRKILIKAYNNPKAIQEIIQSDHSGFTEPILTLNDEKLIDSLTTIDNLSMQMDSTNSIGRVAEGAEGKHTLGFIPDKLKSKWLDSIARKRYKKSGIKKM